MNLNSILVFSENPEKLSKFYEKVFGKKPEWVDSGYYGFNVGQINFTIGSHDKVKGKSKEAERIMINFEVDDVKSEFERIKKAADPKVIAKPYSMGENNNFLIATFEDIDGNYFQLMTPFDADIDLNLKN